MEGLLRASIAENSVELHLPLLLGVPHLARAGDADMTVHPFWARRAVRLLEAAEAVEGGDGRGGAAAAAVADASREVAAGRYSRLSELPGKEHWWWDTRRENDGGALNDDEMRAFFAQSRGGAPSGARPALPALPDDFTLRAHAVSAFGGRRGWRILQAVAPARMASARIRTRRSAGGGGGGGKGGDYGGGEGEGGGSGEGASADGPHTTDGRAVVVEVSTRNVRRLRIPRAALSRKLGARLVIDGDDLIMADEAGMEGEGEAGMDADGGGGGDVLDDDDGGGSIDLCRPVPMDASSRWQPCGVGSWSRAERGPMTAGTIRQVAQAPFAIVYGSGREAGGGSNGEDGGVGASARDDVADRAELESLAVYLANLFVMTSDASPAVVPSRRVRLNATCAEVRNERKETKETKDDDDDLIDEWLEGVPGDGNLILVGGPLDNAATAEVAAYWASVGHAAAWTPSGMLQIGGCAVDGAGGSGALILGPLPGGGLALVIDGDSRGLRDAIAAGEPTIPPMARSPFSNTLPDYVVTGPEFGAKGFGGLLAAGFLDYKWAATPAATWLAQDCRPATL